MHPIIRYFFKLDVMLRKYYSSSEDEEKGEMNKDVNTNNLNTTQISSLHDMICDHVCFTFIVYRGCTGKVRE